MSAFFDHSRTHFDVQIKRHLRSPALWLLALAAPIAAKYLVPKHGAGYSVMSVNDSFLTLNSGVIGLQLGVVLAVILSPLAYIFLRAGPTRHVPWQAEDVTPASRRAQLFGQWLGDTAALWILMLALALAGVILSFFRLPLSEINPAEIVLALILTSAPALAVIAAFRTAFAARPLLRGAWGDVLFFFLWIGLITLSAAFFAGGGQASPLVDVFGFAAPIGGATDFPIENLHVGGAPSYEKQLTIDAMRGVLSTDYLLSRVIWMAGAAGLVILAGTMFKARKPKLSKAKPKTESTSNAPVFKSIPIPPTAFSGWDIAGHFVSEWRQILSNKMVLILIILTALAGAVLPLRGMVGPALVLILIFPLTAHGARWQARALRQLTGTNTASPSAQFAIRAAAAMLLCLAACVPALIRSVITGVGEWSDIAAISFGLPLIAITLGHATRGSVTARLILLILWYGYLNMG